MVTGRSVSGIGKVATLFLQCIYQNLHSTFLKGVGHRGSELLSLLTNRHSKAATMFGNY